jgi:hypothetical protein
VLDSSYYYLQVCITWWLVINVHNILVFFYLQFSPSVNKEVWRLNGEPYFDSVFIGYGSTQGLVRVTTDCTRTLDWVAPPILLAIWDRPAEGSGEKQYISFCFRYVFAGANHQAGFSPWRAIGWFNTMTTGKRRQAANCVQSHLN